jgi:hypothetical protein
VFGGKVATSTNLARLGTKLLVTATSTLNLVLGRMIRSYSFGVPGPNGPKYEAGSMLLALLQFNNNKVPPTEKRAATALSIVKEFSCDHRITLP